MSDLRHGATHPSSPLFQHPRLADNEWADNLSHELERIGIGHHIVVRHHGETVPESRVVAQIVDFSSVRELAAALERSLADAHYSAASGFTFVRRDV